VPPNMDEIIERHFPRGNEFVSYSHAAAKEACRRAVRESLEDAAEKLDQASMPYPDMSRTFVMRQAASIVRALAATLEEKP